MGCGDARVVHPLAAARVNFAEIPLVESRYPLWDLTHPERTSEIPHTHEGWEEQDKAADAKAVHIEKDRRTAAELGIPMPTPTIKPLVATLGLSLAFVGLIWHRQIPIILLGGAIFVISLYAWVLTPLEPEH